MDKDTVVYRMNESSVLEPTNAPATDPMIALVDICKSALDRAIENNTPKHRLGDIAVLLPTQESIGTKKNRVRLFPDDKKSPFGVIVHRDGRFAPNAVGRFKAVDILMWLAMR